MPPRRHSWKLLLAAGSIWLIVQVVAAYSLVPSPPRGQFYGQLATEFGPDKVHFDGDVLDARAGDIPITNGRLPQSTALRAAFGNANGVALETRVIAAERAIPALTPVVRLADDKQRELAVLAREGADLIFGVYTGADVLRLRSPRYRLQDAFASTSRTGKARDTIVLRATLTRNRVHLVSTRGDLVRAVQITPRLSQAWRLVLPFRSRISGRRMAEWVGMVWTAAGVFPLGYWVFFAAGTSRRARWRVSALAWIVLAATAAFLIAIALAFHVPLPVWWEWAALTAGLLTGGMCARRMYRAVTQSR